VSSKAIPSRIDIIPRLIARRGSRENAKSPKGSEPVRWKGRAKRVEDLPHFGRLTGTVRPTGTLKRKTKKPEAR
jgi:hypothetical protein